MGDVATPRDSANADVTLFWRIRHQNGQCQSGSGALWFVSFFIFTIAWSYILGASDVRRYIGRRANPFTAAWDVRLNVALSVSGSLVLQLAMMVATAQMLRDPSHMDPSSPAVPLSYPLAAWLIRPLPATVVLLTSLISPTTYTKNGLELQFIEVLYGLPCLAIYSSLESRAATASTNLQLLVSPTAPIDGVIPTPQAKSTTSNLLPQQPHYRLLGSRLTALAEQQNAIHVWGLPGATAAVVSDSVARMTVTAVRAARNNSGIATIREAT
ncbi:MAG: hypothetical protein M1813_001249 [Trichoglossum hirsutum]|nr:MAG: hypothetical protein M1813_001249 [Trichoglossum hirsutum]